MHFLLTLLLAINISFLLPAFAHAGPELSSLDEFYKIQEYDELTFTYVSPEGKSQTVSKIQVLPTGTVTLPHFGEQKVEGLTVAEVKHNLDLKEGEAIDLIVQYHQRKHVFVIGEVKKPGSYSVKDMLSVYDGIATAGGFTEISNKRGVKVIRQNKDGTRKAININFPKEVFRAYEEGIGEDKYLVQEGDIIYVPDSILKRTGFFMASIFRFASLGAVTVFLNRAVD